MFASDMSVDAFLTNDLRFTLSSNSFPTGHSIPVHSVSKCLLNCPPLQEHNICPIMQNTGTKIPVKEKA